MDTVKLEIEICKMMKKAKRDLTAEGIRRELSKIGIHPTPRELRETLNYLTGIDALQNVAEPRYHLVPNEPSPLNTIPNTTP